MRTTLKRGIGRAAGRNGNGRAIFPPAIPPAIVRYRQPDAPKRSLWRRLARGFLWLLALALLVAIGAGGGAYLYYNETIDAVSAHSRDVKIASKQLDIPLPGHPTVALVVGSDKRAGPEAAITGQRSDTLMLLRADPNNDSISMLSFPRDLRA